MYVPFSVIEAPQAESPAEARELLEQFATTPLAAIAIHNTGSTLAESDENLRPYLPDGISLHPQTILYKFGTGYQMGDIGMHLDHKPSPPGVQAIYATHHFTVSGETRGSFFRLGSEWATAWGGRENPLEKQRIMRLYRAGAVDPSLLLSPCYRTMSRAGTRVIFKNGLPLAHIFEQQTPTRFSVSYDSLMRVTPDLGIRTDPHANPADFYMGPYQP